MQIAIFCNSFSNHSDQPYLWTTNLQSVFMKLFRFLTLVPVFLFLVACSSGPTESDIKKVLVNHYEQQFGVGAIDIVDLKLNDSFKKGDVHHHDIAYRVALKKSAEEILESNQQLQSDNSVMSALFTMQLGMMFAMFDSNEVGGKSHQIAERVALVKSQRGWAIVE